MIAELGKFLALLALVATLAQGVLGLMAGHRQNESLAAAAAAAAQAAFIAALASFAALVALFLRSDFSVEVVVANSHTLKPLIYKFAGTWGNHEGSMLLWCMVSALFGAIMASTRGGLALGLWSRAVGVMGLVTAAALIYTLFLSSPFARLDPAPLQGQDLNPLLQDPALAAHPPMLYLGYVGMAAPYALAIAALLEGKIDQAWAKALRPWTIAAWTCLTIGIALGSWWAYYELGWGGWWFWDPVENASFMPWLAAAALMHSAIVTERRGSLAGWTMLLAILAFGLALLGTFLVRSGVLTSVHAFAVDPERGTAVLVIFALAVGIGLALYTWRAPLFAKPPGFTALSREGALVFNNLALAVATGTVLIGTLYPLLVDAATGQVISVGPPFFNATFAPLMAVMFIAVPIAPFLTWRKADLALALPWIWGALLAAVAAFVITLLVQADALIPAIGFALGAWLIVGALAYAAKRLMTGGAKMATLGLAAMTLGHVGLGVMTIGSVAETGFRKEQSVRMAPGDAVEFAGRTVRLQTVQAKEGPNYYADQAVFQVTKPNGDFVIDAERRFYPAANAPTTEVGILPGWDGDLYLALGEPSFDAAGAGGWIVRLYHNPLIQLIFIGAGLMAAGGAAGLLALARRARRQARTSAAAEPQFKEATL
jgi:cytochrome c-type biogenesis protein CcmF